MREKGEPKMATKFLAQVVWVDQDNPVKVENNKRRSLRRGMEKVLRMAFRQSKLETAVW